MQAVADRPLRSPLTKAFLVLVPLIYAVETLIVRGIRPAPDPMIALAVTVDLTLFVPLLYWLMVVRPSGASVSRVVAAFVVSLLGARLVLPAHDREFLAYARYAVMPLELALVWWVVVRVRRFSLGMAAQAADIDVPERIFGALVQAMPYRVSASAFATEFSLFWCAFASWRRAPHVPPGARAFTYHRKSGITTLLAIAILATVAETIPIHFVVRHWSEKAAWVFTSLSIVAVVWLLGFIRAVRLRPVLVTAETVTVRCGVRWRVEIPRSAIRRVDVGHLALPPRGTPAPGLLRAVMATQPNVLLTLDRPVVAEGMYGRRREATTIAFAVDDRDEFRALLT